MRSAATIKERVQGLLPQNSFVRNAGVLAGGTAAGQVIVILASPVLTRLYTPEDFGVLAVFAALLAFIVVVASLRYQLAIPLPKRDEEASNVLVLSLCAVAGMTVLTGAVMWAVGDQIVEWTNTPMLANYLWLLPIGVAFGGTYQAFNYWAVRLKKFSRIARTKFQQGSGKVGTQIGLGLAQLGPVGLIIGQIVGQAAGVTYLARMAWRDDRGALTSIQASRIRWFARRYRRFPIYSTWSGLANTAGDKVPLVLFAAFFSPVVAGLYVLAYTVLKAPMSLLGQAVGQVFHSDAAIANREETIGRLTLGVFELLSRASTGPLILFAAVAPEVFVVIFGENWLEAGIYAQFLVPMLLIQFIFSPLTRLFPVLELQKGGMVFQLFLLATRIVGIGLGALYGEPWLVVALYAGGSGVVYFLAMWWVLDKAMLQFVDWMHVLLREALTVLPIAVIVLGIKQLLPVDTTVAMTMGNITLVALFLAATGLVAIWRVMPFIRHSEF